MADGGARLEVIGTVELKIKIKQITTTIVALVTTNLCVGCILGSDWLTQYGIIMNYKTRTIMINTRWGHVVVPMDNETDVVHYDIRTCNSITIPPYHEMAVPAS
ncbi:unnamed protein product, partial [Didymodactylos carnosus]